MTDCQDGTGGATQRYRTPEPTREERREGKDEDANEDGRIRRTFTHRFNAAPGNRKAVFRVARKSGCMSVHGNVPIVACPTTTWNRRRKGCEG